MSIKRLVEAARTAAGESTRLYHLFGDPLAAVEAMRPVGWWCKECYWSALPDVDLKEKAQETHDSRGWLRGTNCRAPVRALVELDI